LTTTTDDDDPLFSTPALGRAHNLMEIVVLKSLIINEIYHLYILETALKSTSCATVIFSSSNIRELQHYRG
jgi:hypothetical protein